MQYIVRLVVQRLFVQMPTIPAQATEKRSRLVLASPPLLDLGHRRLEL